MEACADLERALESREEVEACALRVCDLDAPPAPLLARLLDEDEPCLRLLALQQLHGPLVQEVARPRGLLGRKQHERILDVVAQLLGEGVERVELRSGLERAGEAVDDGQLLATFTVALRLWGLGQKGAKPSRRSEGCLRRWAEACVRAGSRACAARRSEVVAQALRALACLVERDLRAHLLSVRQSFPVLASFLDQVSVPALLQLAEPCRCRSCAGARGLVDLCATATHLELLGSAGAMDFLLQVLHWGPSVPASFWPLVTMVAMQRRLKGGFALGQQDVAAVVRQLQRCRCAPDCLPVVYACLALQEISPNHAEMHRLVAPELKRLLEACVGCIGTETAAPKQEKDPAEAIVRRRDAQWPLHNPQDALGPAGEEGESAEEGEIADEKAPKPEPQEKLCLSDLLVLQSRLLQALFQADPTLGSTQLEEEQARFRMAAHLGALRAEGVQPGAHGLALHALRSWLLLSRSAHAKRRYVTPEPQVVAQEKLLVAWLLSVHRGQFDASACALVEGMANDVLAWLYWQAPTSQGRSGASEQSERTRSTSPAEPKPRQRRHRRAVESARRDAKAKPALTELPQVPFSRLTRWGDDLDDALFAGAMVVQRCVQGAARHVLSAGVGARVAAIAVLGGLLMHYR